MRALVTGASGFAGRYLVAHLRALGHEVFRAGNGVDGSMPFDLKDPGSIDSIVGAARADVVFHLAAQTFIPSALSDPLETYQSNVIGTALILEAARKQMSASGRRPRIIFASSAQVYGQASGALLEVTGLSPAEPYAASKAAAEQICMAAFRAYGLDIIIARAFNHIGPGQDPRFVVPGFAVQLARIAKGAPARMDVGNLKSERDFLDVRDVVNAYVVLSLYGRSGEIYNVCSGVPTSIGKILRLLIEAAGVPVEVREDPAKLRTVDVKHFFGDNAKLRNETGWAPSISLRKSINEVYKETFDSI